MIIPVFIMDDAKAQYFRDQTATGQNRLDPRLVDAGQYAGQSILPTRVASDPAFTFLADDFAELETVQLDTLLAWPPEPDEGE